MSVDTEQSAPAGSYEHLEYFGFYASAMFHWNFTAELAPFTNLTWIHVGNAEQPVESAMQYVDRLREAREAGVSAVLSIEPFLFRDDEGHPRTAQEIEGFLVELRARIEIEGLLSSVAMIYPADEPVRNFRRARDPDFIEQYVTGEVYEDIYADISFVNDQVRLVFPEIPIGVIFSGYEVFFDFFRVPDNYDWVGFNCYQNLYEACDDRSHVRFYHRLLAFMQPHQRLIAVPQTWIRHEELGRPGWAEVLRQRLRHHYEIALNEPRFVAFVPFIWSFDVEEGIETPGLGLNRAPEWFDDGVHEPGTALVEAVRDIGMQVKHRDHRYPNLHWSQLEAHPARPDSVLLAEITSVDDDGWVSGWALDRGFPHKNLRVQLSLQDPWGRDLGVSGRMRTDLQVADLEQDPRVDQPLIGSHGFRIRIPKSAFKAMRDRPFSANIVWLKVYADGEAGGPALAVRYRSGFPLAGFEAHTGRVQTARRTGGGAVGPPGFTAVSSARTD